MEPIERREVVLPLISVEPEFGLRVSRGGPPKMVATLGPGGEFALKTSGGVKLSAKNVNGAVEVTIEEPERAGGREVTGDSSVPAAVRERFLALRRAIYGEHAAGGGMHVVLDDLNVGRDTVEACTPMNEFEKDVRDLLLSRTLQERAWLVGLGDDTIGIVGI